MWERRCGDPIHPRSAARAALDLTGAETAMSITYQPNVLD